MVIVIEKTQRRAAQAITEVHFIDYWSYCRYGTVFLSSWMESTGLIFVSGHTAY
jgi:hypothetical protein